MAQTAAQTPRATGTTTEASASPPEQVLDRADLLPHLDTIRRQYPGLYHRLRREVPPEPLQRAVSASATTAGHPAGTTRSAAEQVQDRATASRTASIDALLRQDVRPRASRASSDPKTADGGAR